MTLFEIDPNLVKPGWTPLLIIIGIACVMVLLFFSMRRQFRKITVPPSEAPATAGGRSWAHEMSPASPPDDVADSQAAGRPAADIRAAETRGASKPDTRKA